MGYQTFARTGDIYQLCYERGCQILKPIKGLLTYITSNSWLKANYGKSTRLFLAENHRPLLLLELGKDVFETAIVDSGVLVVTTGGKGEVFPAVDMDRIENKEVPPPFNLWGQIAPVGDSAWSVLSKAEQDILVKMKDKGTILADWNVGIFRGITTGLNDAFVVDSETRRGLITKDPNSADLLKPVFQGKDIQRFRAEHRSKWLIATHNGYGNNPPIDLDQYPAIREYLDGFNPNLEQRQDKGITPYNLRNCTYHGEFAKEKLLWIELVDRGRFAYDISEAFCTNSAYMLSGKSVKYLCAVLNALLVTWFMRSTALTSGMGATRWIKSFIDTIPVPDIPHDKQRPFVTLVDKILKAKNADPDADTSEFEREIDRLVYELYGLTEEEIAAVAGNLEVASNNR